jgi:superoxide dismutase, Fe-Mn family
VSELFFSRARQETAVHAFARARMKFLINGLKREQLTAMNSMILHELFFDGLGEQSEPGTGFFRTSLSGTSDHMSAGVRNSSRLGKALGGGSGWVLPAWSPRDRKLLNQWASDKGGTRMLARDVYEHSYHIDFGAKAASYVDAFMSVIRWRAVDQLFGRLANDTGRKS